MRRQQPAPLQDRASVVRRARRVRHRTGEVDVDPKKVRVAQEYQIVYAVKLTPKRKLARGSAKRVPGQFNIYDSVPGMKKYSPIWQFKGAAVAGDAVKRCAPACPIAWVGGATFPVRAYVIAEDVRSGG